MRRWGVRTVDQPDPPSVARPCPSPAHVRHPSGSWGIPVGGRRGSNREIPAFAGMTDEGRGCGLFTTRWRFYPSPTHVRHPSGSWGIPVGGRRGSNREIPAFAGMTDAAQRGGNGVLPPVRQPIWPKLQRSTDFCAWRRFSASCQISDCGPSITSGVTSSPRCAGRQWRNFASGLASAISAAST